MSNTIKVAAGFSVGNSEAIDDRLVVNTIAERNSILSYRRYIGLETIVRDGGSGTLKKYRLEGGITNTDWKDISENGVIETRDTNATANTIPLRDSNGNFQIKLAQDKIFVGNTFGNAEQRTLPYSLTGQGGKAITVKSDLSGYEYTSFPTGSLNNVTVKSGVTGLTATKTGDNVELDTSYPNTLVQSGTGYQVLKSISSNKLLGATLVQGSNITISETDGEAIGGLVTKRLTISSANTTWANIQSKPNWTGFMPTSTLVGNASKYLAVNSGENAYEYKSLIWNDVGSKPSWVGYMPITSLSGNANKVLTVKTDETGYEYRAFSNVAGSNTQVMFNDGGILSGDSGLIYNKTIKNLEGLKSFYTTNTTNRFNACFGFESGLFLRSGGGQYNSFLGSNSGANINGGNENTLLGFACGFSLVNGGQNIFIGPRIGNYGLGDISNRLAIESRLDKIQSSEHLIEGDFSQRWVRFNGALRKRVVNITSVSSINNGTATSATTNSITDTSKTFTVNEFQNKFLVITGGVGVGQAMLITSNTATTITTTKNFTITPDNTSTYKIINGTTILGEKLNSEYYFDLTTEDYVVVLPVISSSDFSGSSIDFCIKTNPSNKKLYVLTTSTNKILPDNVETTHVQTPYTVSSFVMSNVSWNKTVKNIQCLQPIKISTKDLVIDLYSKIYKIDVAAPTTVTFNIDSSYTPILTDNSLTIELDINMTVASAITWPVNVTWIGGSAPTFGSVAKYRLVFRTEDAGTTWLGNLAYTY